MSNNTELTLKQNLTLLWWAYFNKEKQTFFFRKIKEGKPVKTAFLLSMHRETLVVKILNERALSNQVKEQIKKDLECHT
ncbi:hypothetical protein [Thalassobellus suaedae]|uniref:Uncharacterized protein n=1 Tax=Thalassobellus suaedae TaxID=3074124 RepID=A0ABY9XWF5_9FLAO|nr:hypothetical protein RHP51_05070 [Flavobacteriaceae bacterium HL-DH14]